VNFHVSGIPKTWKHAGPNPIGDFRIKTSPHPLGYGLR
jgi:hypothetical protein